MGIFFRLIALYSGELGTGCLLHVLAHFWRRLKTEPILATG